ncbi:MAG TPA: CPBP family glutamic-type intramembrane protease [Steroidobacteraceae bacterium]|nr:CPBP family glutamic-type intramembrane protease [Steroidobacteraceae bacterium]
MATLSSTQIGIAARRPLRAAALLEVGAMVAILLSYIWWWQGAFPGASLLMVALYFGIGILSHARRGERPREIGIAPHRLPRALRNVALVVVPAIAVTLAIGSAMDSWHFRGWEHPIIAVTSMLAWATAQQYGLLCFFYRRFCDIFVSRWAASAGASAVFATMHAPNGFLIAVTAAAGLVACALYRRVPNVLAIGIGHAALSYVLLCALPFTVTHGLRVGPGYLALP